MLCSDTAVVAAVAGFRYGGVRFWYLFRQDHATSTLEQLDQRVGWDGIGWRWPLLGPVVQAWFL